MAMLCTQLFELGLDEHHRRQTEVDSFFTGQMMAVTDSQQKTTQILTRFEEQRKKVSCHITSTRQGHSQETGR